MAKLKVHSLETFGTHDGPGIRLVVFLQGCSFRCKYCHNPDTQELETDKIQLMTAEEIMDRLERQRPYFGDNFKHGGLTLSGGEPTLQVAGITELFKLAKRAGFHTCLDTNGATYSEAVKKLYQLTDLVMLDVKHINNEWHQKLVGANNFNTLKNAKLRESQAKEMWLRYVLVPGWSDQEEYLEEWASHFKNYKTVSRVEILPYHELGKHKYEAMGRKYFLSDVKPPNKEEIDKAASIFKKYLGEKVVVV